MSLIFKSVQVATLATALSAISVAGCGRSASTASQTAAVFSTEALTGTWAKLLVLSSEASALGIKSKAKVARYSLVNLTAAGGDLQAEEKNCEIVTANSGGSKITFPKAILNAIPDRSYAYTLSSDEITSVLSRVNAVEALGVDFEDQLNDSLPTSKTDSRIVDQDLDDKPGITVDVEAKVLFTEISAELYVVQRTVWNESAVVVDSETMRGSVDWTQEQLVLGSSNALFTSITPKVTVIPEDSFVILKKLPEGTNCAELSTQKNGLFPPISI